MYNWLVYYITYFLVFCSILCFNECFAQKTDKELATIYFELRENFRQNFIYIGEGSGKSLPAVLVDPTFGKKGLIKFGDAPVYLGFYYAVLATEFKLCFDEHGITKCQQPLAELYYAMLALKRLDLAAEPFLVSDAANEYPLPKNVNGFFIRDDVSVDLGKKLFNNQQVFSDYCCLDDAQKNALSQDQIIGLLYGLSFVIKLVDNNIEYKNYNFNKQASTLFKQLVEIEYENNWVLKNPVTGKKVPRGAYSLFQSYPMAESACKIVNENYHNRRSTGISRFSWWFAQWPFVIGSKTTFIDPFEKKLRKPVYDDINNSLMLKLACISDTWRPKRMRKNSVAAEMEVYYLSWAMLFDAKSKLDSEDIEKMLATISSKGAYFFDENNKAPGGWASRDRWSHARHAYTGDKDFKGYYPSLDFMLLYNLWRLCY